MRAGFALTAVFGCVLSLATGCGGGGSSSSSGAHRPGTEPIPSSEPQTVVVSDSSSGPRYARPMGSGRRRGATGAPSGIYAEALAREARREREMNLGPESLESRDAQGRRIAAQVVQQVRNGQQDVGREESEGSGEGGPCGDAWRDRLARGVHRGNRGSLRQQRADFMRTCRALPEEQQRCLSLSYMSAHAQECAEIQDREGRRLARRAGVDIPRD